jgi:hypothetical protein
MSIHLEILMYDALSDYSDSYSEAREKFLAAMQGQGTVKSILHPSSGPQGEELYMDFGIIGPEDAEVGLVLVSGTHGPEGLCGSGSQTGFLNSGMIDQLADIRIVLLHAHNPYGFAWWRRTNEDNIDLNRNYCDFSQEHATHPGYNVLRPIMVPENWDAGKVKAGLDAYEQEHGKLGLLAAMVSGQGHDPQGMFYRGTEASWSRKTLQAELPLLLAAQSHIALIDYHTGLGPFGVPYLVHGYEKGSIEDLAFDKAFDGQARSTKDTENLDEDLPSEPKGPLVLALDSVFPDKQSYGVVIEYGTVPTEQVFPALMQDNWLHAYGDLASEEGKEIKKNVREVFYPTSEKWREMVWERSVWSINCAIDMLRTETSN